MMNIIFILKDTVIVKKMEKGFAKNLYSSGHAWKRIQNGYIFEDKASAIDFCREIYLQSKVPYYIYQKYSKTTVKEMKRISTFVLEETV